MQLILPLISKKSCGSVRASVLCNVRCNYIDAEGCILITVTADSIVAKPGSIIYNIVDDSGEGLDVSHGQVLAGVFSADGSQMLMKSSTQIDGGMGDKYYFDCISNYLAYINI